MIRKKADGDNNCWKSEPSKPVGEKCFESGVVPTCACGGIERWDTLGNLSVVKVIEYAVNNSSVETKGYRSPLMPLKFNFSGGEHAVCL